MRETSLLRVKISVAAVVAALAASLTSGVAAGQTSFTPATVTVESFALTVTDGPLDQHTDVEIDVDVYVPSTATASTPAPAVILAHGFGGSKTGYASLANALAERGYVAVSYSARGFGDSSHEIGLDSIHYDVKDAQQLMDALAERPDVLLDAPGDPRVAWHGDSYGGGIALQIAAHDDRVDTIVPRITWSSLVYALAPNNLGVATASPYDQPFGNFKTQWTTVFFSVGTAQPVLSPNGIPVIPPTSECPGFVAGLCETYLRIAATGRGDQAAVDLLKESSPDVSYDTIDIPTFVIQGQSDTLFNLRDAVRNYTAVRDNGADVKMLWFNGGHSGSYAPGEIENVSVPDDVINSRLFAWFDRYLRGDTSADPGPGFEYFRDWVGYDGNASPAYASADRYPAIAGDPWRLNGDGTLVPPTAPAVDGARSFFAPPLGVPGAYSETSAVQGSVGQDPFDIDGLHLAWESEPFAEPHELVGLPELTLQMSSVTGEASFHAKIYDVAPNGDLDLLRRLVAPTWTTSLPGPVTLTLPGYVHRFDTGHTLRVVLASTDLAYGNRRVPDQYTVTTTADASSTILLPLRAVDAAAPEPEPTQTASPEATSEPTPAPEQLPATGGGLAALGLAAVAVAARRRRS